MKYTLLGLVQAVAAKIKSDEVSALDETVEAVDIKNEILATFTDLISINEWEFLSHRIVKLDARTVDEAMQPTQPKCCLNFPDTVVHVESVMYERQTDVNLYGQYTEVVYLKPAEFQRKVFQRDGNDEHVELMSVDGVEFRIMNNKHPSYFTSLDEKTVIFDSYDAAVDPDGVNNLKVNCVARVTMSTEGSPEWTPDVPEFFHNLWYHESVARCSSSIRGIEDGRAERMARRSFVTGLRMDNLARPDYRDDGVNYGR